MMFFSYIILIKYSETENKISPPSQIGRTLLSIPISAGEKSPLPVPYGAIPTGISTYKYN
jgi:hypothetical protein